MFSLALLGTPAVIAAGVLVLERWWPVPPGYHPFSLFTLFVQQCLRRAWRPQRDELPQQQLAGLLATCLLLILLLLPAWFLYELSELPAAISAVLLWLALYQAPARLALARLELALMRRQKNVAREQLSFLDGRDSRALSALGLARAGGDLHWLSWYQQHWLPWLGFLMGGPMLALAVRGIAELAWHWPPGHQQLQPFARVASFLQRLLDTLGALLLIPLLWLGLLGVRGPRALQRQVRSLLQRDTTSQWSAAQRALLSTLAQLLQLPLGGPIQFQGVRVRRQRFGPALPAQLNPVTAATLVATSRRLTRIFDLLLVAAAVAFALGSVMLGSWR